MLAEMRIQGLGVIDDATLELHPGLTALTGETGAGKTMVVTGLSLLSGGRAESSRVAEGAGKVVVEGRFLLDGAPDGPATRIAEEVGAEPDDDGSLIAVRTVGADGRSRAHLGGRSVPVGVLGRLADAALAVHGQNEALRLLRPAEQRAVLDRYAGDAVAIPLQRYRAVRMRWRRVAEELVTRRDGAMRLAQEADLLRHGLAEIAGVDPQPAEDAVLVAEARRLAAADDLRAAAGGARVALTGAAAGPETTGDQEAVGALDLLAQARRLLAGTDDPELTVLDAPLAEADALLADTGAELTAYLDRLDADPERLAAVLDRQSDLRRLTRKYAVDVDGVLAWAEQAGQRLANLDTSEDALAVLAAERDVLATELADHAAELSNARAAAAKRLGDGVTIELAGLAMPDARLEVVVATREVTEGAPDALPGKGRWLHAGADGTDDVELRLVPHAGAGALPLHRSASGGELSRVMLALEVVLADADPVPTMVFDEVDAGVGGRAAVEIGRRLAQLARSHQVIVVTHLPQVAAYADRHLVVAKTAGQDEADGGRNGRVRGQVRAVAETDRIVELARMLAGLADTSTGRAHAEELLATAQADKSQFAAVGGKL